VVFALRGDVLNGLKDQFRQATVERVYLAIVYGHPSPEFGVWRDRLTWDGEALIQTEARPRDPRAKPAESRYRVLEGFRGTSLIEVQLVTGKRNQIRLQAALRGHTLVGERLYVGGSGASETIAFDRQALHAFRLAFDHPVTRERLRFEAPIPSDMAALIASLRASGQPR
jgi:23S rRNA pseudouridine1911/1915/1917 synthase